MFDTGANSAILVTTKSVDSHTLLHTHLLGIGVILRINNGSDFSFRFLEPINYHIEIFLDTALGVLSISTPECT